MWLWGGFQVTKMSNLNPSCIELYLGLGYDNDLFSYLNCSCWPISEEESTKIVSTMSDYATMSQNLFVMVVMWSHRGWSSFLIVPMSSVATATCHLSPVSCNRFWYEGTFSNIQINEGTLAASRGGKIVTLPTTHCFRHYFLSVRRSSVCNWYKLGLSCAKLSSA